ncbi:MAG TPA: hypothetical protein VHE35_24210 [Kofleriaceae bacterium]|nr:hypothetical protein [Kofleriaceae bacterium]
MQRREVEQLRVQVLHLHKALVDDARVEVERVEGRLTPHTFLDRLLHDPAFAWLKPLSALIVAFDEWLDDEAAEPAAAAELAGELRRLLVPDAAGDPFQQRYAELLPRNPAIVLAHAAALRAAPAAASP